jgi:hypothetical protein
MNALILMIGLAFAVQLLLWPEQREPAWLRLPRHRRDK